MKNTSPKSCATLLTLLVFAGCVMKVGAQFVLINDNRGVSVSGPGYSQSQVPSGPFATFNGSVSGSGGSNPYLASSATQYSTISTNSIYVTNSVYASYGYGAPGGTGDAFATNRCEITFNIIRPTLCRLSGLEYGVGDIFSFPTLSLSSAQHGTITSINSYYPLWSFFGVLQPDTYVLYMDNLFDWSAYYDPYYTFDQGGINASCSLVAIPPPTITSNPQSVTAAPGGNASFSVAASGDPSAGAIAYQWLFNGNAIPGATNALLTLTNVTSAAVGPYTAVATNLAGSATSAPAFLSFLSANMYAGLTILGNVGSTYRVDYRTDLGSSNWTVLTYVVLPSSSYIFFDTNSIYSPRRFYRAIIQ